MYGELIPILTPLFAGVGVGFVWGRLKRPYDVDFITSLVLLLGTPCLVFSTLVKLQVQADLLGQVALAAVIAVACFLALGGMVLRLAGLSWRAYLPALAFPNAGNMGLPLCLYAFGEPGLALAIAYFAVTSTGQFTLGMRLASGHMSIAHLARTPHLYAIALALVFVIAGKRPPAWLLNATDLVGGMTIPLMLITLGVSLARLRVANVPRSLALSLLRLVMGFAIGLAVAEALDITGVSRGVVVIQSAMPVAVFNYLFAQRFRAEPEEVAGMIVISTAISFATLPLLLLLVL